MILSKKACSIDDLDCFILDLAVIRFFYLILELRWAYQSGPKQFIKIWANLVFLFHFRSFHNTMTIPKVQSLTMKIKKHRWGAWDLNPGPLNGRRRRIHWAMAAPVQWYNGYDLFIYFGPVLTRGIVVGRKTECISW